MVMAASEYSPILCRASLDVTFHLAVWKSGAGEGQMECQVQGMSVEEFRIDLEEEKSECC